MPVNVNLLDLHDRTIHLLELAYKIAATTGDMRPLKSLVPSLKALKEEHKIELNEGRLPEEHFIRLTRSLEKVIARIEGLS